MSSKLHHSVKAYLFQLQSHGTYSFTLEGAFDAVNNSQTAIKRELARLTEKQKIKNIRQGFYIIVPPEYAGRGTMPVVLYIDGLMKFLKREYYVGLLSAGELHGAGHQKIQSSYVMTGLPALHDIHKNNVVIIFTSLKNWPTTGIVEKKTDTGMVRVSSLALTALDLIKHQKKLGGLSKISTVLGEIAEEVTQHDLESVIPIYPSFHAVQRLGFIWDRIFGYKELSDLVYEVVIMKPKEYTVLKTGLEKRGSYDPKWKIIENTTVEPDL